MEEIYLSDLIININDFDMKDPSQNDIKGWRTFLLIESARRNSELGSVEPFRIQHKKW